jgi:integrase
MEIKRHYRPEKVKKYEARWYVEKRLKCRFFATEAEREQFIDEFQEQLSQNGTSLLLGFDPAKMRRWQEASRLAPDADPVEVMRFCSDIPVHEVTTEQVTEFIHARPYADTTKNHTRSFLNTVFKWFKKSKWLQDNPVEPIPPIKVTRQEPGILTVEETEQLFAANQDEDPVPRSAVTT